MQTRSRQVAKPFVAQLIYLWFMICIAFGGAHNAIGDDIEGKMCVVRIVEGTNLWPENIPASFRIIVEGIGDEVINVRANMGGRAIVDSSDRSESFKMLFERLQRDGFSPADKNYADKIGKRIEAGGTVDFAVVSLFRSCGWILRSSGKVYEAPSLYIGKFLDDKEFQLRPRSVFSISELYFEAMEGDGSRAIGEP